MGIFKARDEGGKADLSAVVNEAKVAKLWRLADT